MIKLDWTQFLILSRILLQYTDLMDFKLQLFITNQYSVAYARFDVNTKNKH